MSISSPYITNMFYFEGSRDVLVTDPGMFCLKVIKNNGSTYNLFTKLFIVYTDTRESNYHSAAYKMQYYSALIGWNSWNTGHWANNVFKTSGTYNYSGIKDSDIIAGGTAWIKILSKIWNLNTTECLYFGYDSETMHNEGLQYFYNSLSQFHSDPVYVEATKLKYTDGTYNFIRGVATSERARKAAYKSLLNSYGSFYKGTEEQLSQSFNQSLE